MVRGVRIHAEKGDIDTVNEIQVASHYIGILNEQLENSGWDSDSIKYKDHEVLKCGFVIEATAPNGLETWLCQLEYFSGIKIHNDQIIFTLKILFKNEQRERGIKPPYPAMDTRRRISELAI